MKIVTIIGARPQFVKAAAVSREISNYSEIEEVIIHTGQHFDKNMSEIFFEEMEIPKPNYNLDINSVGHGAMTGRMLEEIEKILVAEKPDWVMVYGDTNSTLAGALAAKKLHIKVAHVEAGLRSFNMQMPEEINRILTDRISDILFCPTQQAVDNLKKEGYENIDAKIILSGDVMQDAAMYYSQISQSKSSIIKSLNLKDEKYALVTIHRQENTDDFNNLSNIVNALNELHVNRMKVICPLHPRTRKILKENNISTQFEMIEPVGYFDMIELIKHSEAVITDSGGLQKEAFFFHKQCITLREQTEWIELIENNYNRLIFPPKLTKNQLVDEIDNLPVNVDFSTNLYGAGQASSVIVSSFVKKI